MAKAKNREVSLHSRAARRGAASPPPKGSANKSSTVEETDYKPWLHNTQNAGISKRKKSKPLSRQQRQRHQKGLEHGERNVDRLEKKIGDSKAQSKKIQARAKAWDELNEKLSGKESGDTVKQGAKGTKDSGAKAMEGLETAHLQQSLSTGAAEGSVDESEQMEEAGTMADAGENVPQPMTKVATEDALSEAPIEAVDDIE